MAAPERTNFLSFQNLIAARNYSMARMRSQQTPETVGDSRTVTTHAFWISANETTGRASCAIPDDLQAWIPANDRARLKSPALAVQDEDVATDYAETPNPITVTDPPGYVRRGMGAVGNEHGKGP